MSEVFPWNILPLCSEFHRVFYFSRILGEELGIIQNLFSLLAFFPSLLFPFKVIVAVPCHLLNPSFPVHFSLCLDLPPRNVERCIHPLAEEQMCKMSGVFPADFTTCTNIFLSVSAAFLQRHLSDLDPCSNSHCSGRALLWISRIKGDLVKRVCER